MNRELVAKLKIELYNGKSKIKDLANKYNISQMQVARIACGDSWPDILPHLTRDRVEINYTPEKTKKAILKQLEAGKLNQKAIAEKYGVSETVVHRLKKKNLL